jgi:diguanylate cyclase (GGDEF)-like protein/PAS domain S-box-containing protein
MRDDKQPLPASAGHDAEKQLQAEQELTRQIFASSLVGIAIYDCEGNCVAANAALARQIGASSVEHVLAQNFHRIESWKRCGLYERALHTQRTGVPSSVVVHVRTTFGRDLWQMTTFSLLRSDGNERLMLMADDLTEFKRAEIERNEIQRNYEMMFSNSLDGMLTTSPDDGGILAANPAACEVLGLSEEEICRRERGGLLDPDDPRVPPMIEERARTGRVRCEVRMIRGNGERFEVELSSFIFRNAQGKSRAGVMFRDITERKRAEIETHRLAYFDVLTGLPNRRLLVDRISHCLAAARRSGQHGALLFLDLDNFKRINDARGHSIGDKLLAQLAQRLTRQLRSVDMVARLGGDEFVVLVNDLGPDEESAARGAMLVAEKLRQILDSPYMIDGYLYSGTGSVGVTMFPKAHDGVDDLLREADTAMYRAKESGRNRIAYFEAGMQAEVEERLALEHDLQGAIDAGQIDVHLQAQVDASGYVTGGELLLRWNHPGRGSVSPSVFIPVAEESGLILRLGDLVIERACAALARLQQAGNGFTLSVNISPRQFRQEEFVERMRARIEGAGLRTGSLVFEVTEGLLIEGWEAVAARMAALASLGIRFSIDDFGTGYSSLSYLKRLPLHELKIDRSFVKDAPDDANDTAIVESIIAVARHLKLRVVAEGVETREQADFLASRCDGLQGFLFSRPEPLDGWLAQRLAAPAAAEPLAAGTAA